MTEIAPKLRYSRDAVRRFQGGAATATSGLNPMAEQIASQYRRDTMSPVMVSGTLRLVEF